MKLAHLADLHLGFRQYHRQTARGGNQREADVAEAFRRAVDDLLEQRPDLIVLAGDIFHSIRPTNAAILFFFRQIQRLRIGLPEASIVMIAGDHDTPRSTETSPILKLYDALGVETALDVPRRILFPRHDCAVLAVPHAAMAREDRPALRPEPGGPTLNVLVTHGHPPGLGEARGTLEYGGAIITREDLAPEKWDYVALGHYHTGRAIEPNVWYPGSLEYVTPNPWGQLQDEQEHGRAGKGYLLVELPGARVTFRSIAPVRRHVELPPIHGAGLTPKQLDAEIAARVKAARPAIDDQIVRLLVWDVSRGTARDLDHAAIRGYKNRAFHFQLDVRRPEAARDVGTGALSRRQTLPDTVQAFLTRRPLDADLDRGAFVRLGVEYVEAAGGGAGEPA